MMSIIEKLDHWRASMVPRTLTQASFRTMAARDPSSDDGGRFTDNARIVVELLLGVCTAQFPQVAFAHPAVEFNAVACYQLVEDAGRPIAWARWEKGFPLEKARSEKFRDDTRVWANDLVQEWIADAYHWRATDEQIRQWAAELGSVDDLPSTEGLSVHETIAIWMRRIARDCGERGADARASATLMRDEVRLEQ